MYDSDREARLKNSSDPNYRKNELRRMAKDQVVDTIRGILVLIGIGLLVLFIDGWRRDYGNLSTEMMAHKGNVNISVPKDGKGMDIVPRDGVKLDAGAQITTGADSFATIAFPDGSALRVEPNSSLTIQLLDYFRTGRRDRSFSLDSGSVFVRQSANAGPLSQLSITTGNAIVAGKAASSWRVSRQNMTTQAEVVGGSVVLRTATMRREVKPNQQIDSTGSVSTLTSNQASKQLASALTRYDVKPNFWTKAASSGTRFMDPLLQKIGLTLQGWNPDKTDITRKSAAYSSLKKLATLINGADSPETLNPVSMNELGSAGEADRLRKDFAGLVIDGYQKVGTGYTLRVRARDSKGTPYELRNGKISGG